MSKFSGFELIESQMTLIPEKYRSHIINRLATLKNYKPTIGIMGKTGVGKSSLCNALFQGEVSPISDVSSCTRDALYFRLQCGDHHLTLIDLPGVGESQQRDAEYEALYRHLLPDIDMIIWIIKADDRALAVDEYFYQNVLGTKFNPKILFVINQADKIEPSNEGSTVNNIPSEDQLANLNIKIQDINSLFQPINPVCAISVKADWNLNKMVEILIECLPEKSSSPVSAQLHRHLRTDRVIETARNDFGSAVGGVLDVVASLPVVPRPVKSLIHQIRDAVVSIARCVWDFFF